MQYPKELQVKNWKDAKSVFQHATGLSKKMRALEAAWGRFDWDGWEKFKAGKAPDSYDPLSVARGGRALYTLLKDIENLASGEHSKSKRSKVIKKDASAYVGSIAARAKQVIDSNVLPPS